MLSRVQAGEIVRGARSQQRARPDRGSSISATTRCARRSASRSRRSCRRRLRSSWRSRRGGRCPVVPADRRRSGSPGFVVGRIDGRSGDGGDRRARTRTCGRWRRRRPSRSRSRTRKTRVRDGVTIGVADSSVRLTQAQNANVTVEIWPAPVERRMPDVPVRWRNLGTGLRAQISPQLVHVTVRGAPSALAALRGDSVQAFVDLAGLGSGRYNLRVQVDPADSFGVVADRSGRRIRDDQIDDSDCSAPTVFEARRVYSARSRDRGAPRRGARPRDARGARRSGPSAAVHRRPRYARVRRLDRARARRAACTRKARRSPPPASSRRRRPPTSRARWASTPALVISASHNPFEDNGIKVFSGRGEKFTDALEQHVESIIADTSWQVPAGGLPRGRADGRHRRLHRAHAPRAAGSGRLARRGFTLAHRHARTARRRPVAPRLFRELGFDVTVIGDRPDGRNINLDCGSDASRNA